MPENAKTCTMFELFVRNAGKPRNIMCTALRPRDRIRMMYRMLRGLSSSCVVACENPIVHDGLVSKGVVCVPLSEFEGKCLAYQRNIANEEPCLLALEFEHETAFWKKPFWTTFLQGNENITTLTVGDRLPSPPLRHQMDLFLLCPQPSRICDVSTFTKLCRAYTATTLNHKELTALYKEASASGAWLGIVNEPGSDILWIPQLTEREESVRQDGYEQKWCREPVEPHVLANEQKFTPCGETYTGCEQQKQCLQIPGRPADSPLRKRRSLNSLKIETQTGGDFPFIACARTRASLACMFAAVESVPYGWHRLREDNIEGIRAAIIEKYDATFPEFCSPLQHEDDFCELETCVYCSYQGSSFSWTFAQMQLISHGGWRAYVHQTQK